MSQSNTTAPLSLASKSSNKNHGKITWPQAPAIKQQLFSLPFDVINYISKITPEAYLKLAQCCKYFFEKNPIIVAARITTNYRGRIQLCSNTEEDCARTRYGCCVKIDIAKISSKIWLTYKIDLSFFKIATFAPLFAPKIYRCDVPLLRFRSRSITLIDFQLLASKFQNFHLDCVRVVNNDGSTVMLDDILESIPNVNVFNYYFGQRFPSANFSTMKNILKLPNLADLSIISLCNIPEIINADYLADFIKKHNNTKIWLRFNVNISQQYKNKVNQLIDSVIDSGVGNCFICYAGQDQGKLEIMKSRFTF